MSTKSSFFVYPNHRLGISSRVSVYIIAVGEYHQPYIGYHLRSGKQHRSFVTITLLVSIDINTAYKIFHAIFFPGKSSWILYAHQDPIILDLPQEFFINCAILIVISIILLSLFLVIRGFVFKKIFSRQHTSS